MHILIQGRLQAATRAILDHAEPIRFSWIGAADGGGDFRLIKQGAETLRDLARGVPESRVGCAVEAPGDPAEGAKSRDSWASDCDLRESGREVGWGDTEAQIAPNQLPGFLDMGRPSPLRFSVFLGIGFVPALPIKRG
jgi:hypothetical protein